MVQSFVATLVLVLATPALASVSDDAELTRAGRVPRRAFFCAAMLTTKPVDTMSRAESINAIKGPKTTFENGLAPTEPRGLLKRFIAWLTAFDDFQTGDLNLEAIDTTSYVVGKDKRHEVRKALRRLREVDHDLHVRRDAVIPVRNIMRGRDEIRGYLRALKKGAQDLEDGHSGQIAAELDPPQATGTAEERRLGKFLKDAARAMFFTGLTGLAVYGEARGWQLDNIPLMFVSSIAGAGFGIPGAVKAWPLLRTSFGTAVAEFERQEIIQRRREHERVVIRADAQIRQIDRMLESLDAEPATVRNLFWYHGYLSELGIRSLPTYVKAPVITEEAIVQGETLPDSIDPVLNRWVAIDQIFQFDENGEPTLVTIMREQLDFAKTIVYDEWINNSGFLP